MRERPQEFHLPWPGDSPSPARRAERLANGQARGWTLSLDAHCCSNRWLSPTHWALSISCLVHSLKIALLASQRTVSPARKWEAKFQTCVGKAIKSFILSEMQNLLSWKLAQGKVSFSFQTSRDQRIMAASLSEGGDLGRACVLSPPQSTWELAESMLASFFGRVR